MITYETLRLFTYSNDELITRPIRGIVLDLMGLGDQRMFDAPTERGKALAQKGIVLLIPYNDPWAWMNARAVANTDAIVRALMRRYALAEDIPIVSSGGSMGGLAALVYTRYAALQPVACVANCPVCDLPYHYTSAPTCRARCAARFPRTTRRPSRHCLSGIRRCTWQTRCRTCRIRSSTARPTRP
jgi:hypothetical protein